MLFQIYVYMCTTEKCISFSICLLFLIYGRQERAAGLPSNAKIRLLSKWYLGIECHKFWTCQNMMTWLLYLLCKLCLDTFFLIVARMALRTVYLSIMVLIFEFASSTIDQIVKRNSAFIWTTRSWEIITNRNICCWWLETGTKLNYTTSWFDLITQSCKLKMNLNHEKSNASPNQ